MKVHLQLHLKHVSTAQLISDRHNLKVYRFKMYGQLSQTLLSISWTMSSLKSNFSSRSDFLNQHTYKPLLLPNMKNSLSPNDMFQYKRDTTEENDRFCTTVHLGQCVSRYLENGYIYYGMLELYVIPLN